MVKYNKGDMVYVLKYYKYVNMFQVTDRKEVIRQDDDAVHIKNEGAFKSDLVSFNFEELKQKADLLNNCIMKFSLCHNQYK